MKTKKALYNIISELTFEVVALICGLILPKMVLEAYGSAYNGVIQTIIQFLSYTSVLTLGVTGPTRVAVYRALADEDNQKLHGILKANELYMRKVGGVLVIYMVLLAFIYPYLVREEFGWWDVASLVLIIGTGDLVEYVFGCSSRTLLKADQRTYIYTLLMISSKIASTLIAALLVRKGFGIHAVRLAMVACFATAPILTDIITKTKYHINSKAKPDYSALEQRGDAVAYSIAGIVEDSTPTFLLALFTNPITVSIYSVYNLILNNILKIQEAFTSNLEGAFGEFWAKGEKDKFKEKLNTLEYLMFVFLLLIYTTTGSLLLPFMKLYTADITDANYILPWFAFLFTCCTAAYSLRTPYVLAVQAAGKYRETRNMATIEAILNVAISLVGVCLWGLNGVVIGSLAAYLYRTFSFARYTYSTMLGIPMRQFVGHLVWLLASSGVIVMAQLFIVNGVLNINGWLQWIVAGAICVIVAGIVIVISSLLFYKKELRNSIQLVKVMLSR